MSLRGLLHWLTRTETAAQSSTPSCQRIDSDATPVRETLPERVSHYRITGKLGQGGMATGTFGGVRPRSAKTRIRKNVDRVDKTVTQEQEQLIYMFCRSQPALSVWKEGTLRYESLGDQRQLTSAQNFATLSERLRTLAPHAFHDQRLLTHKRRADISVFGGGAREHRLETSNARKNDLGLFCSSEAT